LPTDFQKKIRTRFHNFAVKQSIALEVGQQLPSEYEFGSSNKLTTASLGFNFIALTSREYSHWANFKEEFKFLLEAFTASYGSILSSRIGLRYINEITPESIGFNTVEQLLNILNKDLKCLIINSYWSLPRKIINQISIPDDDNELTLRMAFDQDPDIKLIIDLDYFTTFDPPLEMTLEDIRETLEVFHRKNYYAFRWSIEESPIELFSPKAQ
jgi:uncharacterized protein (TIGR04255 family)